MKKQDAKVQLERSAPTRELLEGKVLVVTLHTAVAIGNELTQFGQLAGRTDELIRYAGIGYRVASSVTLPGVETVVIVDTLELLT